MSCFYYPISVICLHDAIVNNVQILTLSTVTLNYGQNFIVKFLFMQFLAIFIHFCNWFCSFQYISDKWLKSFGISQTIPWIRRSIFTFHFIHFSSISITSLQQQQYHWLRSYILPWNLSFTKISSVLIMDARANLFLSSMYSISVFR